MYPSAELVESVQYSLENWRGDADIRLLWDDGANICTEEDPVSGTYMIFSR